MFYPEDFKERCKDAYPENKQLHKELDNNSSWVGRYLFGSADGKLSVDAILGATSLEGLKAMAQVEKERHALYIEWYLMAHSPHNSCSV